MQLIEQTKLYDHIYNWFDLLKLRKKYMIGYVIMPNHIHGIVHLDKSDKPINDILGTGKRFMAYDIVKRLKNLKDFDTLETLSKGVSEIDKKRGKLHSVFEPSLDIKEIVTERFMIQKLNYIHFNPVRGKWNLAEDYRDYQHSSAGFYDGENTDDYKGYPVIHYQEVL